MDYNAIMTLLQTVGFPIVCCGALFWQQNKTMADFSKKMEDSFSDLTKTVKENTAATTQLVTTVEVIAKVGERVSG